MGDVVRLSAYRCGEAGSLLRALAVSATAGDVLDVHVRVRTRTGEVVIMTGYYRRRDTPPSDTKLDAL